MHPPNTPQTNVSPYKIISENTRLAELRLLVLARINRPQTPTKLVLNRAFQVDTNTDRHLRWALRCCLTAPPACGRQGQWPGTLREAKMSANDALCSQQVHKVTQGDC